MKQQKSKFLSFEDVSKKGISQPMIAIALGIVFIVIVVTVGVSFQGDVKKIFEKGPFKPVKPDATSVTGTLGGTGSVKVLGSKEEVANKIAQKIHSCWEGIQSGDIDKPCPPRIEPAQEVSRQIVLDELAKLSEGVKIGKHIIKNWEKGYSDGRWEKFTPGCENGICGYLVCVEYDRWSENEITITGSASCPDI